MFEEHHRVIWTYIARLAGLEAADEVTSEVFTRAFALRDRYDPERGAVRSWLYGIAINRLRDRFRGEERARRAFSRVANQAQNVTDPIEQIEDAGELRQHAANVLRALEQLPREQRELVVLFAWEELPYSEIAEIFDVPVGTIRSRLSRTRARIRELTELDGELSYTQPERN